MTALKNAAPEDYSGAALASPRRAVPCREALPVRVEESIPGQTRKVKDLWTALNRARAELGLIIERPIQDGRLHRCRVEDGKPGALDGAYRICTDPPGNVWGQNFKTGGKRVFLFGGQETWSLAERAAFQARIQEERRQREAAQRQAWDLAAARAEKIYAEARPCNSHPYLTRKGVLPHHRLRVAGSNLVVPLFDSFGILRTLQFIDGAGTKRFLRDGRKVGCFLGLDAEKTNRRGPLLIAEGISTALSLFQATANEVWAALDAGNLKAVSLAARQEWPGREIILAADNDASQPVNVGLAKAREAAEAIGGKLAVPFLHGGNRAVSVDFNDLFVAQGPEAVKAFINLAYTPGRGAGHGSK